MNLICCWGDISEVGGLDDVGRSFNSIVVWYGVLGGWMGGKGDCTLYTALTVQQWDWLTRQFKAVLYTGLDCYTAALTTTCPSSGFYKPLSQCSLENTISWSVSGESHQEKYKSERSLGARVWLNMFENKSIVYCRCSIPIRWFTTTTTNCQYPLTPH